jgi:single-stranded-DNA-specific exonuclease
MDFLEKLLDYYGFSKQDYEKRVLAPSFSSLPLIDAKEETQKAIQALTDAKSQGEKVLVYGDYDTDGIMSASIMVRALREFGLTAEGYLPSRYKDGYGLTAENVDKIADKGFNLIFTTDNGVTAYEALDEAKKRGLKVIILDHHEFGEKAPEALAVLHPTTLAYGDTPISAGYLSFIFSCALLKKEDDYLLTLGAMSTLSDLMPLTSYNREIVRLALEAIQKNNYPEIGLLSDKRPIDETILQMEIIPKLNAVGRLLEGYETNRLLKYFSLVDPTGKEAVASWLNSVNEERKEKTKAAELSLSFDPNEEALVVLADIPEGPQWLIGQSASSGIRKAGRGLFAFEEGSERLSRLDPEQRGLQRPQGPRRDQDAPNERRSCLRGRGLDQSRGFPHLQKRLPFRRPQTQIDPAKRETDPLNERGGDPRK